MYRFLVLFFELWFLIFLIGYVKNGAEYCIFLVYLSVSLEYEKANNFAMLK